MKALGDFLPGNTIRFFFNTCDPDTGTPITLAGTPSLAVYKDGGTTQFTTGVTLTVDFDAVTGLHKVEIVTTDAAYSFGSDFAVVIAAGTVDAISAVGAVVAEFSIGKTAYRDGILYAGNLQAATSTTFTLPAVTAFETNILAGATLIIPSTGARARVASNVLGTDVCTISGDGWSGGVVPTGTPFAILYGTAGTEGGGGGLDAAATRAALGMDAADLDAQLDALGAALAVTDGVADAIKIKTDSLTFNVAGHVDANIQRINDVTLTGNGSPGTEFGV